MIALEIDGCTEDQVFEALSLLDGDIEIKLLNREPVILDSWSRLPKSGSQRQAYLLHFLREGKSTRERAKIALGNGASFGGDHTRVTELLRGGLLMETNEKMANNSGEPGTVLVPTETAKRLVKLAPRNWFPNGVRVEPKP